MHPLSRLWPLPLGFVAGLIAVPFLFRWLLILLASLGKLPPNLGNRAQRPRKVGIARAIVHPVPLLLLLGCVLGIPRIVASTARVEWIWFLVGIATAPAINGLLVCLAWGRIRAGRRG